MKKLSPRNRSLTLREEEIGPFSLRLLQEITRPLSLGDILDRTICQDLFTLLEFLPAASFDLIIADPPYNLDKDFGGLTFGRRSQDDYQAWLDLWLPAMARLLKPQGSIYVCGDWRSSASLQTAVQKHFLLRNRITWEREKGRAAGRNWKNSHEDIWFATLSSAYYFNPDKVRLKRRIMAPYVDERKRPKDWQEEKLPGQRQGRFRLTAPSNLWTDITVPFWSMAENTVHPTQKPEKLLAKLILASSREGEVILDPFAGVGSCQVTAKKLKRHYVGVEINRHYCLLAEKRLLLAESQPRIQGYQQEIFWERNSGSFLPSA
ncbi:MAG: site-specific DNA-methyltransferase [Desulfarculales bacterium]|jgi:site-specific DNA-methyltransferase (adenine-specific)|nr:site-specific DNA-methyltransferase [Desulfarculales bacterium]